MRMFTFSKRNFKEIFRDPINVGFGLGFPLILLLLLSIMQKNIPVNLFEITNLTPGITVFGLSFLTLFSATLIAKDRSSAFLQRLYTTPMTATDFIIGYTIPLLPLAIMQCLICYIVAIFLGLKVTVTIIYTILFIIPISLFFISMGLLFGSILGVKQVGGICGALITNLTGWLSGTWFDLSLMGNGFKKFANLLPFVHAVELERSVLNGDWSNILPHIYWILGYAVLFLFLSILLFLRQMKRQ